LDGIVTGIFIADSAGAEMCAIESAVAEAGAGLESDRYQKKEGFYSPISGPRQLTLIEEENLEVIRIESGIDLTARESRRNLSTRGIRLNQLVGKRFSIGDVLCEGIRLCPPCNRLDELTGKPVLAPLIDRGGLRADIVQGGTIRRGDAISVIADPS
jgi:MOSC domain-containing protein YiiM